MVKRKHERSSSHRERSLARKIRRLEKELRRRRSNSSSTSSRSSSVSRERRSRERYHSSPPRRRASSERAHNSDSTPAGRQSPVESPRSSRELPISDYADVSGTGGTVISDDAVHEMQAGPSGTAKQPAAIKPELLQMLGKKQDASPKLGPEVHPAVADIWTEILQFGLENKAELLARSLTPGNLPLIRPPALNEEVKVNLTEASCLRDGRLVEIQAAIGASLASLGAALTRLLAEEQTPANLCAMDNISNAGRLLCDVHHNQTLSRRALIGSTLTFDKALQDMISTVPSDKWLFGENLGDKMSKVKDIQRTAADLRGKSRAAPAPAQKAQRQKFNRSLNLKSLPRQNQTYSPRLGRQQQQPQRTPQYKYNNNKQPQQRNSSSSYKKSSYRGHRH